MKAKLTLGLLSEDHADPAAGDLLRNARKNMGFVPNMYAEMAHAPGALSTYLHGYDWFRKHSGLTPAEQEVVFLAISRENACHYCVAGHSMIAEKASKVPPQAIAAIRNGEGIDDPRLRTLAEFVVQMVNTRGTPARPALQSFLDAGYTEQHVLQIVLAIAVKTISNYTNHLFDTPVDAAFASYGWPSTSA